MNYVVCESYPEYRLHIREIKGEPVMGGYGKDKPTTLCKKTIDTGWDTIAPLPKIDQNWTHAGGSVCPACYVIYTTMVKK